MIGVVMPGVKRCVGRPRGSNKFTLEEAKERNRLASAAWYEKHRNEKNAKRRKPIIVEGEKVDDEVIEKII